MILHASLLGILITCLNKHDHMKNNVVAVTIQMEKIKEIACRCHHLDKIMHASNGPSARPEKIRWSVTGD